MNGILSYPQTLERLGDRRKHILLGNGFSIACDSIFKYPSLYEAAVNRGLSERAQLVFDRLGTNNFEGVMRLLDDAHSVAEIYGLLPDGPSPMLEDVEVVKRTLVEAVATSHLEHTGCVADERKSQALAFLDPYHNVFTTNYDLLAYWVNMHAREHPPWGDGFRADDEDPEAPYLLFSERLGSQRGLFYLHGALHLYVIAGELRKHCWIRSGKPLTQLIREGLEEQQYPLFVAEGSPRGKLEQIQRNGYLWYCLDKFSRIETPLLVLGHSLGRSDEHIANAIADNPKLALLAIGLHGDPESESNQAIVDTARRIQVRREENQRRHTRAKDLDVIFYQSETARVWD